MNKSEWIIFILGIIIFGLTVQQASSYETTARVISYEPILEEELVYVAKEHCYKKKQKIYSYTHPAGGGTHKGGQLGQGLATIATPLSHSGGVLLTLGGALMGHLYEREKNSHIIESPVCDIEHTPEKQTQFKGYLVTYEYNGQYYQTRVKTKPGSTISIKIQHEVQ